MNAHDVLSVSAAESDERAGLVSTANSGPQPVRASDLAAADPTKAGSRSAPRVETVAATGATAPTEPEPGARTASESTTARAPLADPGAPSEGTIPRPPLTVPRTVWPGAAARRSTSVAAAGGPSGSPRAAVGRSTAPRATRLGDFSPVQLLGSTAVLGVFALALIAIAVLLARFVLALGPGQEFLAAYPGEYHLPESAPVGLPAWLNWSHFLNSFFLLFIIRTGWQVRNEKRPAAFWSPRRNKRRRISLTLWFHQAIDILWIANGVVFVVLLFVTGQWMRIVPTSWEVFPNALSAALQYASLDWPTENGWVNYNSLQQLSYFAITFLAAPLAILSGVRLSGVWPKDAERLNRLYPIEWARRVHFPTMLFFVAFIVVHVALVLATGALRNLNHMYAARGAVDPGEYTSDPTGLLIFAASLLVMAAGWVAARPRILAPIARLFGEVKQR
jgi:thiosulfate reductase cytochrome b subunit